MRWKVRKGVVALLTAAILAILAAPSAQASFGVSEPDFEAGTCSAKPCTYAKIEEGSGEAFTQAAGHPAYGITSFELNSKPAGLLGTAKEPEGALKRVKVDIPPGLAANPQALPKCSIEHFDKDECPAETQVGEDELTVFVLLVDTTFKGTVYNLEQPPGLPLEFGIHVDVEPIANEHILLEGHVAWNSDYHEYFEIKNISKAIPVLKSKLIFEGTKGGNFLTLPSVCSSSTTSHVEVESYEGAISTAETHTPVGVEGCDRVPFKPTAEVKGETASSDQPDGATTLVKVPQNAGAAEINTADINDAHVTLPEGMTLNPSAAHGLGACTEHQIAIGTTEPVSCPASSKLGTVTIETDLPPKTLTGNVYLGSPGGGTITKPPFTLYLDAESVYGVSVRLKGTVTPNPTTGRLEVSFAGNPQLPFSELILTVTGGPRAPLANPLSCGNASVDALFTPYSGGAAAIGSTPFTTTGCASPLPFSLSQSTSESSATAGAYTSYTLNLQRAPGQQYLSKLSTVLPAGLVGAIPSVPLCAEPQAQKGECPASSNIGTANVDVGAGSEPYAFSGPVSLTGPYAGAPYGLSIPVEATAGPFDLGRVVTRVAIDVDPYSGRVIATSAIPTIVEGVPLRLQSLSVAVNRANFLFNPTSCNPLATNSQLTSTFGAGQSVSSAFQVSACGTLAFKPSFTAATSAKADKKDGASLQVKLTQPSREANLRSVVTQLPLQLPTRLATLQKACPEASFAAGVSNCPKLSKVGTATVSTPVLPLPLSGSAYLVSHGGAAFPDLDLVLEGNGVKVILVGNNNIKGGITTTTFASVPDVPVSSFSLDLPMQENSALSPYGNLCLKPLLMPTTITAQSGAQTKQETRIAVSGCGIRILSHRVARHKLILKVRTLGGGLITVKGKGLRTVSRRVRKSSTVTFKIPLTRGALRTLRRHRHRGLSVAVNAGFRPTLKGAPISAASATIKFKH